MNHTQNHSNIRRPASGRNTQTSNTRRPVQRRARTTSPHRAHPGSRPPARRNAPAKQKQPTSSRNLFLAAIFAALILVTIIIGGVQSCAADKKTDGVVTTAPPKIAGQEENSDDKSAFPALATFTDNTKDLIIDSEYGILIDLSDNTVVASKNGDSRIYPASMTKIMTLIVAYEHIEDLNATYTFPAEIFDPLYQANASVAGFKPGETVPYRDLLYGTALPSGADATTALALTVAGDETAFAELMNQTAQRLGLKNTHFAKDRKSVV